MVAMITAVVALAALTVLMRLQRAAWERAATDPLSAFGTWRVVGGYGDPAAAPRSEQTCCAWLLLSRHGSGHLPVCVRDCATLWGGAARPPRHRLPKRGPSAAAVPASRNSLPEKAADTPSRRCLPHARRAPDSGTPSARRCSRSAGTIRSWASSWR
jgi:hypothetical protein